MIDVIEFKKWLKELDAVAKRYGHKNSYTKETGEDCWLGYFEDGDSPEQAYTEDCPYG